MPSYYDDRDALWNSIPAIEFLDPDEFTDADYLFTRLLDDVEFNHIRPQDSEYFDRLIDLFGFAQDADIWDWDDFKEWYSSL